MLSSGSNLSGTKRASRSGSCESGSPRAGGLARKTRSTVRRAEPGLSASSTNATRVGSTVSPVSSRVSRLAHAAMLSPACGVPPGSVQSSVPSRARWMSKSASSRNTTVEQRTSVPSGVSMGVTFLFLAAGLGHRSGGQALAGLRAAGRTGGKAHGSGHPGSVSHSQPAANIQPASTSPGQCTPRYTRLAPTAAAASAGAAYRGLRAPAARTHAPAVRAAMVVCFDGRLKPSGSMSQAAAGGRGRAITRDRRRRAAAPVATTRSGTQARRQPARREAPIPATMAAG